MSNEMGWRRFPWVKLTLGLSGKPREVENRDVQVVYAWGSSVGRSCAVPLITTEIKLILYFQVAPSVLLVMMLFRLFFHSDREVLFSPQVSMETFGVGVRRGYVHTALSCHP